MATRGSNRVQSHAMPFGSDKHVRYMKNNKSPGSDCFTAKFFQFLYLQLGAFIVKSLNNGFVKSDLSSAQKEGVIISVAKEDKTNELLKNPSGGLSLYC